jgi:hypothetical protein
MRHEKSSSWHSAIAIWCARTAPSLDEFPAIPCSCKGLQNLCRECARIRTCISRPQSDLAHWRSLSMKLIAHIRVPKARRPISTKSSNSSSAGVSVAAARRERVRQGFRRYAKFASGHGRLPSTPCARRASMRRSSSTGLLAGALSGDVSPASASSPPSVPAAPSSVSTSSGPSASSLSDAMAVYRHVNSPFASATRTRASFTRNIRLPVSSNTTLPGLRRCEKAQPPWPVHHTKQNQRPARPSHKPVAAAPYQMSKSAPRSSPPTPPA